MGQPFVFYPNDPIHSAPAKWGGVLKSKAYITPAAIDIECGKPFAEVKFDPFSATGLLPEMIITNKWSTLGWDGKPRDVPPEILYGIGDSSDYPSPPVTFTSGEPISLFLAPEGVADVCDATSIKLAGPMSFKTEVEPEPYGLYYQSTMPEGIYTWDRSKSPKGLSTWLELEDPEVTILCENTWTYEIEMEWPYVVGADDASLCGPGDVMRRMNVIGHFQTVPDSNEVIGVVTVEVPTVTYSGSLWGVYTGSRFSQGVTGVIYNDESGKQWVAIDMLSGGHGISWYYKLKCPYGAQSYSLFAAVYNYLWIYNVNETLSETHEGFFKFDPNEDERDIIVDKGGQGSVTFRRRFKKNSL